MSRAARKDFELGISTLKEMNEFGLSPDIITFGTLAKCCNTRKLGLVSRYSLLWIIFKGS